MIYERGACKETLLCIFARVRMTAKEVRSLRKALGLTQKQLGEILGVSRVTIVNAEKDGPSKALLAYIDRALAQGKLSLSDRKIKPE